MHHAGTYVDEFLSTETGGDTDTFGFDSHAKSKNEPPGPKIDGQIDSAVAKRTYAQAPLHGLHPASCVPELTA